MSNLPRNLYFYDQQAGTLRAEEHPLHATMTELNKKYPELTKVNAGYFRNEAAA